MTSEHIRVERQGSVVHVAIDRPSKKNALTGDMYLAVAEAIEGAGTDDSGVGAVVIAGGDGVFTAGNDLNDFLAHDDSSIEETPATRFLRAISTTPVPLVAAVDGIAVGVGATLLLHCDVVYVTDRTRLTFPFVQLGLIPEAASTMLLPAAVGPVRAAKALLLGDPVTGAEAVQWGLATELVEPGELAATAGRAADRLASLSHDAVRTAKRLLRSPAEPVADRMATEGRDFARLLAGDDFKQAAAAVLGRNRG
jgi:enoyl-CoA hydratase/carnithine racemase